MTKLAHIALALVALSVAIPAAAGAAEDTEDLLERARIARSNDIELYYHSLTGSEIAEEQAWQVEAREIELPYGKLTLSGGWMVPVRPEELDPAEVPAGVEVGERETVAAVYVGGGRFQFTPPHPTERWTMNFLLSDLHPAKKYSDLDQVDVAIDGGIVMAFNGEWRATMLQGEDKPATIDRKSFATAERLWKARGDLFVGDAARANTYEEVGDIEGNLLTLDIGQKDIKGVPAFTYSIEPFDPIRECVNLSVYKRYALNKDVITGWPLVSWFLPEFAEGKTLRELGYLRQEVWNYDIEHYDLDMTVYKDQDVGYWGMNVVGSLDMKIVEPTGVLVMDLMNFGENEFDPNASVDEEKLSGSNRIIVSEITDSEGNRLDFMHNGHTLTVRLPRRYEAGEQLKLGFKYGGLFIMTIKQPAPATSLTDTRTIGAVGDIINYRVPNGWPWYPMNPLGLSDFYTFEWTLRLPKPMIAATSGTLVGMVEDGKYNVHTIKETTPVDFPAILFGRFSVIENDPDFDAGEYKIRLYVHPGFEKDAQSFLDEAQGVIAYYESLYGPYPFQELDMAQMPIGIGYAQAPAGLVQMDGYTYISKTDAVNLYNADDRALDIRDNFVPHEIGHFWWGHKAGLGTDRDQWVSETFAEYSAALYLEEREKRKSGDPEDISGYESRKRRWGLEGRLGHTCDRTGPVWVGNRTRNRRTSTIYARGPLVLDMLRQNFGREAVVQMMYTWCELSEKNGAKVVTEDLQYILEQVVPGVGFQEFMDGYIKGNEPLPDDPKVDKAAKLGTAKY